jgi:hypothetical protein
MGPMGLIGHMGHMSSWAVSELGWTSSHLSYWSHKSYLSHSATAPFRNPKVSRVLPSRHGPDNQEGLNPADDLFR